MNQPYVHKISAAEQKKIERFLRWTALATALTVALVVGLVLSAHHWLPLISLEAEQRFVAPYIDFLADRNLAPENVEVQQALQQLADSIVLDSPLPEGMPSIHYIESDLVNAFATLGGHVFVTEGLIQSLETENSLMMVIAHEVGHIQQRDPIIGMGRAVLIEMLFYSLTGSSNAGLVSEVSSQLTLTAYSREQEKASDLFALQALQQVYGHVGGATVFFQQQRQIQKHEADLLMEDVVPEWLSSHPQMDQRIDYLEGAMEENNWQAGKQKPYPPVLEKLSGLDE